MTKQAAWKKPKADYYLNGEISEGSGRSCHRHRVAHTAGKQPSARADQDGT